MHCIIFFIWQLKEVTIWFKSNISPGQIWTIYVHEWVNEYSCRHSNAVLKKMPFSLHIELTGHGCRESLQWQHMLAPLTQWYMPLISKWKLWRWHHLFRCVWTGCTKCKRLGSFANHCKRSVLGRHGNLCSEDRLLQVILVVGHCNVIDQSGIKTLPFKDISAHWMRYMII